MLLNQKLESGLWFKNAEFCPLCYLAIIAFLILFSFSEKQQGMQFES